MRPEDPKTEMKKADYVFIGTVHKINNQSFMKQVFWLHSASEITFSNISNIKWDVPENFIITTPLSSASCGINFQMYTEYIVYAHNNNNHEINAWLCWRTSPTEFAEEDLEVFRDIIQQNKNTSYVPKNTFEQSYMRLIFALFVILFITVFGIYKLWTVQKNTD